MGSFFWVFQDVLVLDYKRRGFFHNIRNRFKKVLVKTCNRILLRTPRKRQAFLLKTDTWSFILNSRDIEDSRTFLRHKGGDGVRSYTAVS